MAKIKILAGDFLHGTGTYDSGVMNVQTALYPWPGVNISIADIDHFTPLNRYAQSPTQTPVGMGLAAAMAIAPMCSTTDMSPLRSSEEVTFWANFRDGRKILCMADVETYRRMENGVSRQAFLRAHSPTQS